MIIGLHRDSGVMYQGPNLVGHEVDPLPVITKAAVLHPESPIKALTDSPRLDELPTLLFREDSFDPTIRVRRGRLYLANDRQPMEWHLYGRQTHFLGKVRLDTFFPWKITSLAKFSRSIVLLGSLETQTVWSVLGAEPISTGEQLITLRARSYLGTLPDLDEGKIPEGSLPTLRSVMDKVAETAHGGLPEAVVDRCRDAAQQVMGHWLAGLNSDPSLKRHDLSKLVSLFEAHPLASKKVPLICSAKTIARLHARAKPNEQERYQLRGISESDAECALALLGLALRELEWASE